MNCVVLFCLLAVAVDQILGHSIQPRLIGPEIEDANDIEKNTVAFMNPDNKIACTGSFIHPQWLLTSAWCARKINLNSRYLLSGKLAELYVKGNLLYDIIPHQQFNPATMVNDIALVKLPESVLVQSLIIPRVNKVLTDLRLQVRGLGLSDFAGVAATKLREETVEIRDNKLYCSKYGVMPANTICSRHSIACMGDQGGPLIETAKYIWGVVSMNDDVAEMCQKSVSQPSPRTTYTLVLPHRAWIQKTTGLNL